MKIVDLHTCGCPIGRTDLFPTWSLKTKNFILFDVRFFKSELPFISTRAALYPSSNLKVSFVGTFRTPYLFEFDLTLRVPTSIEFALSIKPKP